MFERRKGGFEYAKRGREGKGETIVPRIRRKFAMQRSKRNRSVECWVTKVQTHGEAKILGIKASANLTAGK